MLPVRRFCAAFFLFALPSFAFQLLWALFLKTSSVSMFFLGFWSGIVFVTGMLYWWQGRLHPQTCDEEHP